MYVKKSVLCAAILIPGVSVLVMIIVLFSFTEAAIPHLVYSTVWFGSLAVMIRLLTAVSDGRRKGSR